MAKHMTIFMKIPASFDMFKRGWGGPERGLTTSLHLKCYISCPTLLHFLWIFKPDRDCTPVVTMTQHWVHVNPQSEMMSQL